MKLNLKLTLIQNGDNKPSKGEELLAEVEECAKQIEPHGWEVSAVTVSTGKDDTGPLDDFVSMARSMRELCFADPEAKSAINPNHTNKAMADYWIAEMERMTACVKRNRN